MRVLVTGGAGLLGRYVCRQLLARGDDVIAVDNLSRYQFFGETRRQPIPEELHHPKCLFVEESFYSPEVFALAKEDGVEAIVHAAAQTSHPRSIAIPVEDFETNALGTLRLLEFLRNDYPKVRLVFISSAKVYGENVEPPFLYEKTKRFDGRTVPSLYTAFDHPEPCANEPPMFSSLAIPDSSRPCAVNESCLIGDQTIMTPFGCSKAWADLAVQNWSKLYGIDACVLRPGCFTGCGSLAVEEQNWLPPLVRSAIRAETYTVFGYKGKQVRDVLHADDLARAVLACLDGPQWHGEVFNVAGGIGNELSILEAVDLIESFTGKRAELAFGPKRQGDWAWFIGSNRKITGALGWEPLIGVKDLVRQLCEEATT